MRENEREIHSQNEHKALDPLAQKRLTEIREDTMRLSSLGLAKEVKDSIGEFFSISHDSPLYLHVRREMSLKSFPDDKDPNDYEDLQELTVAFTFEHPGSKRIHSIPLRIRENDTNVYTKKVNISDEQRAAVEQIALRRPVVDFLDTDNKFLYALELEQDATFETLLSKHNQK